MVEMKGELSSKDIISLIIGIISIILTIYFINDSAIQISLILAVVFVIILTYLFIIFKEVKTNSLEIKKINEKINIYNRLNKLEVQLKIKGDKNE